MILQVGRLIGGETNQGSHGYRTRGCRYGMKRIEARQLPSSSAESGQLAPRLNLRADRAQLRTSTKSILGRDG